MREIIKKILEVMGNEDVILVGKEKQAEIKTIHPEEIELYPKRYKNIIIDDLDQLDEKNVRKLVDMADCLWILFSIDKLIKKVDSTVEDMITKPEFKDVSMDEKIEILKNLSEGKALITDFHLPDTAIVIPKKEEKFLLDIKTEPFSSFFLNLSMVEYLKSKLEEVKREEEKMKAELEMEKLKFNAIIREMEIERRDKEKLKAELEMEKLKFNAIIREMEEKYKNELKTIISEIGLKLEEKEEELKKLKSMERKI